MQLFRITREKYAGDLSGEGAKLYGGRWNRPGVAALYLSQARSLALLELLVHFSSAAALKMNYVFITIEVPDELIVGLNNELVGQTLTKFNNESLWLITEQLFFDKNIFAIKVPSVIIPDEYNVIINPKHEAMNSIAVKNIQTTLMDDRLFKNW
jgi:RES domain-containing protein